MRPALAILFLLFLVASVRAESSDDDVGLALADVLTLPPEKAVYTRYLTLSHFEDFKKRERWMRVVFGHVNGVSLGKRIVVPQILHGGRLLRLDISEYGWQKVKFKDFRDVWEAFAEVDPYFHDKARIVVEDVPYERINYRGHEWMREVNGPWVLASEWSRGNTWQRRTKKITVQAPWLLSPEETQLLNLKKIREADTRLGKLMLLTKSNAPILRGDWLFQQTAIQERRVPGYYDVQGIKTLKDFERLIGFDKKVFVDDFGAALREAVARSKVIVGEQARRIEVRGSAGGAYLFTLDSEIASGEHDPLDILDDNLKFDATEGLAPGANGMMKWVLANNKGVLQTRAPDGIASDGSGAANDSRIHVNLMCLKCHSNSGVKDINPWVRDLFRSPNGLKVYDAKGKRDLDKERELEDLYFRKLEPYLERVRVAHATAVKEATGWKAEEYAENYYRSWEDYIADSVDLKRACRDLHTTETDFIQKLKAQREFLPPVFANWLRDKKEQKPLAVTTWEANFADAQVLSHGGRVTTLQSIQP